MGWGVFPPRGHENHPGAAVVASGAVEADFMFVCLQIGF